MGFFFKQWGEKVVRAAVYAGKEVMEVLFKQ